MKQVCLVTGVGPGTGRAIVERFSDGYQVAMIARNAERLAALEESTPNTTAYPCDVTDFDQLRKIVAKVTDELGAPSVVVHNAVGGAFGDFLSIDPEVLNSNFQVNTMALLHLAQAVAPAMIERGEGAILCTANTAAYRGIANFSGFAPTKAAQRILAESMARHLGPKGIHVGFVAIDAVIDLAWTRKRFADQPDEFFCKPQDIAGEVWHLAHQPKSAWTFDVMIRPAGEKW
ncbi:MAG: SDR family NAD(P)-dependent oxidoreductase [Gammaproteobacteria bacterium]|nr:MAG: SDR family NAD(P)-dependent oxidoreductase [Gammaproteobacteria bacterium]TDJ32639.1 MAG: SDR family NAD(P)-dependent oxidoreductase [Gammaproteobacteria bacterium]